MQGFSAKFYVRPRTASAAAYHSPYAVPACIISGTWRPVECAPAMSIVRAKAIKPDGGTWGNLGEALSAGIMAARYQIQKIKSV